MFSLATITRSSALAGAEREAQRRAAEAGADPASDRREVDASDSCRGPGPRHDPHRAARLVHDGARHSAPDRRAGALMHTGALGAAPKSCLCQSTVAEFPPLRRVPMG
jgi:hypothetical protein